MSVAESRKLPPEQPQLGEPEHEQTSPAAVGEFALSRDELELLAVLISERVGTAMDAKKAIAALLDPLYRPGDSAKPTFATGEAYVKVGSIGRSELGMAAVVHDEPRYAAWVAERYPSEVTTKTVTEVREAFTKKITVDRMGRIRGPRGEHDIPGVMVHVTGGTLSVRPNREALAELWNREQRETLLAQLLDSSPIPTNSAATVVDADDPEDDR